MEKINKQTKNNNFMITFTIITIITINKSKSTNK